MDESERERMRALVRERATVQPSGCWLWKGAPISGGYGGVMVEGRRYVAHRLSYEAFVGAIPEGLQLDHLCRKRQCVNPAHLEPVTAFENIVRAKSFLVAPGSDRYCRRGHFVEGYGGWLSPSGVRFCAVCRVSAERALLKMGYTRESVFAHGAPWRYGW